MTRIAAAHESVRGTHATCRDQVLGSAFGEQSGNRLLRLSLTGFVHQQSFGGSTTQTARWKRGIFPPLHE
jgi:hypothetical protein